MCTIFEQYFIHTLANVEYLYLNILYFSKNLLNNLKFESIENDQIIVFLFLECFYISLNDF